MNQFIVTTTIQPPTKATIMYCQKKNWKFIIVGDLKTPHYLYKKLIKKYNNVLYLSPELQEKKYKDISNLIGWNSIQRRNIGLIEAYRLGAEIIATVDDDNIPYGFWGKNVLINKKIELDYYQTELTVFDPLSVTDNSSLWHRGYPIELLANRHKVTYQGKIIRKVLVQADLWDGDPDIDAMARLSYKPIVKFSGLTEPYCANKISPFNSQNTFLSRTVIPYYAVLPHVGRMDDIWGSYILQYYFPDCVVYNKASVYQERNKQDLIKNLENEIYGYRNTLKFVNNLNNFEKLLPQKTIQFYKKYRKYFKQ